MQMFCWELMERDNMVSILGLLVQGKLFTKESNTSTSEHNRIIK